MINTKLDLIRLYVTTRCNAACKMCDIGLSNNKGIDRLRESSKKQMDIDLIKKIVNDPLVKKQKMKFSIGMVEPLLHDDIGEIIELITINNNSVALITNGLLLEKKQIIYIIKI